MTLTNRKFPNGNFRANPKPYAIIAPSNGNSGLNPNLAQNNQRLGPGLDA
jgi:hypothetical protein